ncbi:MAG: lipid kinase [Candidatus Eremiobacteraeota bacterium]|jgi:diacylglycerol kinase (ATP)|nr:lipid kinase [Candidatus Eremiobacteraeota bacterium]
MGKRVLLAVNPRARTGVEAYGRAAAALRERGHTIVEVSLDGSSQALSAAIRAHRDDVDAVVVGGGDGTLLRALRGLVETKLPLAILPLGTFNELARTLGVPNDPAEVAALLDDGVPVAIDVGCVNGVYYLNEASIGLSTQVARLQTSDVKRAFGMFAIPVTTLRALRWVRPLHLAIRLEDGTTKDVRTVQLTVANSYRFGGVVENPEGSLGDGKLWLFAIDVHGWWSALRVIGSVVLRRFQHSPDVATLRGTRFTVRSLHRGKHRVFADGEYVTRLPAEFSIAHGGVTVLVPAPRVAAIR